jgi:hypothetical protein
MLREVFVQNRGDQREAHGHLMLPKPPMALYHYDPSDAFAPEQAPVHHRHRRRYPQPRLEGPCSCFLVPHPLLRAQLHWIPGAAERRS